MPGPAARPSLASVPRLLLLAPAVLAAVALAAGCGGDDESATDEWATDVCSSATTWRDSVESAAGSIGAGSTAEDIEQAVDDVDEATQQFSDDVEALGRPETEAGDEADAVVTELNQDLEEAVAVLRDALEGGDDQNVLEAATAAAAALASMRESVTRSFNELRELDAGGELQESFEDADSCDDLRRER